MFDKVVQNLNSVQSQVWGFFQFLALLGCVGAGVVLLMKGHQVEGSSLMMSSFALLKNDVLPNKSN